MRGYYVTVCELNFEHGIGQRFNYNALAFNYIAFSQNNSSFVISALILFRSVHSQLP